VSSEPISPAGGPSAGGPSAGEPSPGGEGPAPSEQELREAYEAELSAVTSAEMIFQAAVSLLNIAGYRLSVARPPSADAPAPAAAGAAGDLEQVRDAIDAVRGLLPVLERTRPPAELRPLRDALSQLQMAYAREAGAGAGAGAGEGAPGPGGAAAGPAAPGAPPGQPSPSGQPPTGSPRTPSGSPASEPPKGPAESSGRLWVPGR